MKIHPDAIKIEMYIIPNKSPETGKSACFVEYFAKYVNITLSILKSKKTTTVLSRLRLSMKNFLARRDEILMGGELQETIVNARFNVKPDVSPVASKTK